jgi:hypothetical protein
MVVMVLLLLLVQHSRLLWGMWWGAACRAY